MVEETEEPEVLKGKWYAGIHFYECFYVHINWYPVSGIVQFFKHHSGRFMSAYLPNCHENERTTVSIAHESGKTIVVRQIAGAVARRIVCYAEENNKALQGQQMGL